MTATPTARVSIGPYHAPPTARELAARLGVPLDSLCKLDANESPYGPPPSAVAALAQLAADPTSLVGAGRYPDPTSAELRAALEGYTGVPAGQIVVGNGLDEVLALLAEAFLAPGDEVIVAEPTFTVYGVIARRRGAHVVDVGTDERFAVEPGRLAAAIGPRTRLVLLCSPNNPTGTPLSREALTTALQRAGEIKGADRERGPLIVVDEAYYEFGGLGGDPAAWSAIPLLQDERRVVVLRTFSKIFGLAGLRAGYALCPPDIAPQLAAAKQVYNVNVAAQTAALAALNDLDWLAERARRILAERERVSTELAQLPGLCVYPSAANFVLAELAAGPGAREELWASLLDRGILVRRPPGERVAAALRITIGTREQNDRLLDALRELLPEVGSDGAAEGAAV